MSHLFDSIISPACLKNFSVQELESLAHDIRKRILDVLSCTGGHLASNLGIVELTIALHKVFDSPSDKLIFDTSHQSYTHKILTGRLTQFDTLRQYKGIAGFTHPPESLHDHFYAGHAATALSLGLGLAKTRDLHGGEEHILPILGDASLTCGLTFEALNNIPKHLRNLIVVLNDNSMAISKNVGAITNILSRLINNPTTNKMSQDISKALRKIPNCGDFFANQGYKIKESIKNLVSQAPFFEQYNLAYIGPIDGHDIKKLIATFEALKETERPALVHILTTKGKGLEIARKNPISYHGAKPFDRQTGQFLPTKSKKISFPKIFGKHVLKMAKKDPHLVAITPAMSAGSCLAPFMECFPDRCIDVGIAEGHCVTYAGGIAHSKKTKVIACIYSTFLQRAVDNVYHDICLQRLPVLFAIDRAGLAGGNGVTHNGIYDIAFLNAMPNMVITQPRNGHLLKELLESIFLWNRPCAIRYPDLPTEDKEEPLKIRQLGKGEVLQQGKDVVIISLGHMCLTAMVVGQLLNERGIKPTIVDPIFVKPLDANLLYDIFLTHNYVITIEEHALSGGFGSIINTFITQNSFSHLQVLNLGIPDTFVEHGKHQDLISELELTPEAITKKIYDHFSFKELTKVSL